MIPIRVLIATLIAALLAAAAAQATADELTLSARELYESGITWQLNLAADGKSLELTTSEVIEDDGPAAGWVYGKHEEPLSASRSSS